MLVVHLFWSLLAGLATAALGWAWGLPVLVVVLLAVLAGNLALAASAVLQLLLARGDGRHGHRSGTGRESRPERGLPYRT